MNISRSPLAGRNFENFGEDPYLTGVLATSYIKGVQSQSGVGACMKHYVANDMETRRFNMDEQIDERTLREIYLKPFEMALEAKPWSAMTAYPKINGEHADCNTFLLQDILRKEWDFDELVMSDWGGLNDTVKSVVAGTDLEMPGPPIRYGKALLEAVKSGKVSEKDHIDASVKRLLKILNKAGLLDPEEVTTGKEQYSDLPEFRQTTREAAAGAIVLLKNQKVLPLKPQAIKKLAIIGPNAQKPTTGGTGSAAVRPFYLTNPYESLSEATKEVNPEIEISFSQGIRTNIQPPLPGNMLKTADGSKTGVQVDFYAGHEFEGSVIGTSHWQNSILFMMSDGDTPEVLRGKPHCYRASGVLTPTTTGTYDFSLSNTGKAKFFLDDNLVIDNHDWTQTGGTFMNCGSVNRFAEVNLEAGKSYSFRIDNVVLPPPIPPHDNTLFHTLSGVRVGMQLRIDEQALFDEAVAAAKGADTVVLVVGHNNDSEKEGIDRTSLELPRRTNELVDAICRANPNTVVVTQSACAISMPWVNVAPAIVHAWYQGQENGNALADVLLGRVTPSGKTPITFPRRLEDHGSNPWFPGDAERDYAEYGEGILVGYRWFDAKDIEPLWPFGFGLSYTSFQIWHVKVEGKIAIDGSTKAVISATVTNLGDYGGAEVLQAYMSPSPVIKEKGRDSAPRSLVGFVKVFVPKGEARVANIELDKRAVSWFDVEGKGCGPSSGGKWRADKGKYICFVGTSSRDIVAEVDVVVE
ncbi:putative glycoside hydrolase family 3 domain protein [Phaeoacremonium minimum UCRPA7]|uniref:beta-glucosidase n=1 Tax=Phaeoacremonium minimum (strain UCR-PA7) TaxID=1286976 RepID=R8BS96_PHAM7|nr:putative glycoside hydrolase family 3 domain protein [Phaeoacremonium minimum UCRPA7]EOO02199.1 putative glycoside hydrolase family 3 domain protein [Phaeoacremonium minimum UCRPA7]